MQRIIKLIIYDNDNVNFMLIQTSSGGSHKLYFPSIQLVVRHQSQNFCPVGLLTPIYSRTELAPYYAQN